MKILVTSSLFLIFISSCVENYTQSEDAYNFEQSCKFDSIGKMSLLEQQMSDSMLKKQFVYFKIDHEYHFLRCLGKNELKYENFCLRYMRKKPVLKSMEAKSHSYILEITKHVFANYIANEDIMKYEVFNIQDDFFGKEKAFKRDSIFKLCGFKIIPFGKKEWKRVPL